ncbi:MAG: patatin-like phospholipase family protein, partial [Alphaproteobacteria bacterium]
LDNSPAFLMMDLMARMVSPYDVPSVGGNPLADVLAESLDFAALRNGAMKVFVTATNVRTGRARVFRNADLGVEALLASACLPQLFQAVEIDGEAYWDGGFAGNPTLVPLITELESDDTILIPINPIHRPGLPRSARDILDRVNEISFNAVALKELKMMALLRKVAAAGDSEGAAWARMRLHMVRSNEVMVELGYSSKLNAEWSFLEWLRDAGRQAGDAFLRDHAAALGKHSSIDLDALCAGI